MNAMSAIQRQLRERFARPGEAGRIVIWSDPEGRYGGSLDDLNLPDVTVLQVESNEFAIKRRVLVTEPKTKFLLYRHRQPDTPETVTDNWLKDMELAYGTFTADHDSLLAQELGGGPALRRVVEQYPRFFDSKRRREELKPRLRPSDDATAITASMIAVVLGTDERSLEALWRKLLNENAEGKSDGIDEMTRLGLADFHWEGTRDIYGYSPDEAPSVDDFVAWLFNRAWEQFSPTQADFGADQYANIRRDFSTWHNDFSFAPTYRVLADRAAELLGIDEQVADLSLPELLDRKTFPLVDQELVRRLARQVQEHALADMEVQNAVHGRTALPWYSEFEHGYGAVSAASALLTRIDSGSWNASSPQEGFDHYTQQWFSIDQAYRQFNRHLDLYEPDSPLDALKTTVEAAYINDFLTPLGQTWRKQVAGMERWQIESVPSATSFFTEQVSRPWLDKGKKVVVIVSDALRYEVGEELGRRISQEDRFTARLFAMLSALPSYTQLGMAALLPHESLAFADADDGSVEVDGAPSGGTENRAKLLAPMGGTAIQANQLLSLKPGETRELIKNHRLLYVYHNQIDATGDKQTTEPDTFRACEDAIADLIRLVKKLANANVNNILITADHGFLYQESRLEEQDYLSVKPHGDALLHVNHRFVLGRGLKRDAAFITYSPNQLRMSGDIEAQVPGSIHRIRTAGSGTHFVHGGASLQEVVVPVIAVNKRRSSDTHQTPVKIVAETNRITTGQITVMLFQQEPVSEKVKPRRLIAGLYAGDTLISDEVTVDCSQDSAEARDRFFPVTLVLSRDADTFNGKTAELRLAEPVGSERRPYGAKARFTLSRTFTSDFGADFDF
ncbi:BREX-1 system phosphatase PglZ type A [Actinomyces sp.]|uniref:BREX-1 system phosphatase PglZ type A n=1 Tax=Actinomyces sp. TaxID=29317 RepID=UPI0026DDB957|nr:BREX-1 system phosphatase PglZ type A [Actinomyces sp.]MDO4899823.1 BREX-1 system phosphatase PglZ type A [Actinomyces sp.]